MKNFDICCLLLGILIFSLACQFYVVESFVGEQGRPVGVRSQRQGTGQANRQAPPQGTGKTPRQIQPPLQRSGQGPPQRSNTMFKISQQRDQIKKMVNDPFIQTVMKISINCFIEI